MNRLDAEYDRDTSINVFGITCTANINELLKEIDNNTDDTDEDTLETVLKKKI